MKSKMYSKVHKYLGIDKVIVTFGLYHSILELKLNTEYELKMQSFSFNLRAWMDLNINTLKLKILKHFELIFTTDR